MKLNAVAIAALSYLSLGLLCFSATAPALADEEKSSFEVPVVVEHHSTDVAPPKPVITERPAQVSQESSAGTKSNAKPNSTANNNAKSDQKKSTTKTTESKKKASTAAKSSSTKNTSTKKA